MTRSEETMSLFHDLSPGNPPASPATCAGPSASAAAYSSRWLLRVALWMLLLCAPLHALEDALETRIGVLLVELDSTAEPKAVGRHIARLGAETLPTVFDCLRDGSFRWTTETGIETKNLSLDQTNALLIAVEETPAASLESFLRARTTEFPTVENRRTALRLMALIARQKHLAFCVQLAEPLGDSQAVDYESTDHLQHCIERALDESPQTFRLIRALYERAHAQLHPTIIRAVSNAGTERGLGVLSELLGLTPRLDAFILSSMGRVATSVPLPVDEAIARRVRALEKSSQPTLARESLLLLGRFEDADSAGRMILRLSDENQSVQQAAHWALKNLSGLALREEPRRWKMWHEDESSWWREDAPQVLGWLRSANIQERKRGIAILSQRRLRRHELAYELTPLLSDQDESVVSQAARALSILKARVAIPDLLELLHHRSEKVRASAREALVQLGASLPEGTEPR